MGCAFGCAGFSTTRLGRLAAHLAEAHADRLREEGASFSCPDCEYSTPFSYRCVQTNEGPEPSSGKA